MSEINSIYLVASFDLADSTNYKIKHPLEWMKTFDNLRDFVLYSLTSKNFKFLKQNGDEWIIYTELLKNSDDIINKVSSLIDLFEDFREKVLTESKKILNLKGTSWLVPIVNRNPFNNGFKNSSFGPHEFELNKIYYPRKKIENIEESQIEDIVGPQMDEGFRIAHNFAIKGLISSSFSLAFLVSQFDKPGKSFSISYINNSFGFLKSVWKNNPYPKIYIGKSFLSRLKEFSLIDIEMNDDINYIIREFYGKNYVEKFIIDNISNDFSNNSEKQKLRLQRLIDEYNNTYPELKEETDKFLNYFNE